MTDASDYWMRRQSSNYLRMVRGICDTIGGNAKTVLDVGSLATPILEWRRSGAQRLVSIDLRRPYVADGVESITGDFLDYAIREPFDLVTCLQVLEHVPDAATFARKLLAAGKIVVVSVPYKWPKGACAAHIHDPVDEQVLASWFGRLPTSQYIASEQSGICRLVQVYRTVLPPPARQPLAVDIPNQVTISVAHGPRHPTASWPLFSLVRNEAALLPHFFNHYRRLGVDHFFIYDDQSTDETPALLRSQPDCTVLTSPHRFGDVCGERSAGEPKRFCSMLRESLPPAIVPQGWAVVVDIDEFLILPPGVEKLPQMCRLLEDRGQWYATAPMVDFYPETFDVSRATSAATPFEACPYFDVGPLYEWNGVDLEPRRLFRGVRARLHRVMAATQPWVVEHICGARQPEWMAKCWKVPLLKHGRGITRHGDHEISVPPATNCDVALAHFKFFAGFDRKIASAIEDSQYYRQSFEYRMLEAAIAMAGSRSLIGPESRRYSGSESLVEAGLLQPVAERREGGAVVSKHMIPARDGGQAPSESRSSVAQREIAAHVKGRTAIVAPTASSYIAPNQLVAHWPMSGPVASNWGDKLNPYLITRLSGLTVRSASEVSLADGHDVLFVVGSMLGYIEFRNAVIWGAGFIGADRCLKVAPKAVHAVRGLLTACKLKDAGVVAHQVAVGDPALLMPLIYTPKPLVESEIGVIPHFRDAELPLVQQLRQEHSTIRVIDVFSGIEEFCDQIASCRVILSSSLHGLIAAHAYGIPARCMKLSDNPVGDGFKYHDYLSTIIGEHTVHAGIQTIDDIRALGRNAPRPPILPDLTKLLDACPFISHDRKRELSEQACDLRARRGQKIP